MPIIFEPKFASVHLVTLRRCCRQKFIPEEDHAKALCALTIVAIPTLVKIEGGIAKAFTCRTSTACLSMEWPVLCVLALLTCCSPVVEATTKTADI